MNRQQGAMKDEKRRKVETTSRYKRDVSESLIDDHSPTPHLSLSLSPVFSLSSSLNHCRRPRPRDKCNSTPAKSRSRDVQKQVERR